MLLTASAATLLESLKMGCAGFSGVMGNFHPELYSWLCRNFESDPEKAQLVQDFIGFASMAECQMYPVNAKYHLSLCGIDMGYTSRARDASEFRNNRKMEIDGLYRSTVEFKKAMNIK